MSPRLTTKGGYDFYVVSSLLQKAIRRGDVVLSARACAELLPRYANYCWNRLLVVSAEDCADLVTAEVVGLMQAWNKLRSDTKDKATMRGAIFFAKAIVLLAKAKHSRDTDELWGLVVNRYPEDKFVEAMDEIEPVFIAESSDFEIPNWVYDVHTWQGKRSGKTKEDFFKEEHDALADASSMFRNFDEMADTWGYVEPDVDLGP